MMAGYRKIDPRIWNDERFRELSDDGKLAFLFLLTHPSLTCLGAMKATLPGLSAELGWNPKKLNRVINECSSMLFFEKSENIVAFPNFLKYNQPQGQNSVIRAWPHALDLLPEGSGKRLVAAKCLEYLESCSQSMRHAIPVTIFETLRHVINHAPPHPMSDPIPHGMSYSEAEAEAEEEEKRRTPLEAPPKIRASDMPKKRKGLRQRLPNDFALTPDLKTFAASVGVLNPEREFEQFTDHFRGSAEPKADWPATWRKWCRNAAPGGAYGPKAQLPHSKEEHVASIKRDLEQVRAQRAKAANDEEAF